MGRRSVVSHGWRNVVVDHGCNYRMATIDPLGESNEKCTFHACWCSIGCFGTCRAFYLKEHIRSHKAAAAQVAAVPLDVTLYRFELEPNHLDRFNEWVQFEHAHHAETVATIEREKMYFEAIFRDQVNQKNVIYWLAVSGDGGAHSDSSPLPIDQEYQMFMNETLKKGRG